MWLYFARLLLLLTVLFASAAQAVQVVASIPPLAMLANALVLPDDRVQVLMDGTQSEHHMQWMPSQRRALEKADLVLYVSPELESWLVKPLKQVHASALAVQDLDLTNLLPATAAQSNTHHAAWDWHIWMDAEVMMAYVVAIRDELMIRRPAAAQQYSERAQLLLDNIKQADTEAARLLRELVGQPLLVMHDAWRYLFRRYGLTQGGRVQVTPEQGIGGASMGLLEQQLRQHQFTCLLREPQFEPKSLAWLKAQDPQLKEAMLDPLGSADYVGGYPAWLQEQAGVLVRSCR